MASAPKNAAAAGTPPAAAGSGNGTAPGASAPPDAGTPPARETSTVTPSGAVVPPASAPPTATPAVLTGPVARRVQLTEGLFDGTTTIPPFTEVEIAEPELSRLRKLGIVIDPDAPAIVATSVPSIGAGDDIDETDDEDDDEDDAE